jgi:hypothetical protein
VSKLNLYRACHVKEFMVEVSAVGSVILVKF